MRVRRVSPVHAVVAFVSTGWLLVVTVSSDLHAQAEPSASRIVSPGKIVFEHDARDVTGFALYVQPETGSPFRIDLGALKADRSGRVSADLPALPPGNYTAQVAAYNPYGESPRVATSPAAFVVTAPAGAPAHEHGATGPAPVAEKPAREDVPPPDGRSGGIFGRVWKAVIGDDGDSPQKR